MLRCTRRTRGGAGTAGVGKHRSAYSDRAFLQSRFSRFVCSALKFFISVHTAAVQKRGVPNEHGCRSTPVSGTDLFSVSARGQEREEPLCTDCGKHGHFWDLPVQRYCTCLFPVPSFSRLFSKHGLQGGTTRAGLGASRTATRTASPTATRTATRTASPASATRCSVSHISFAFV